MRPQLSLIPRAVVLASQLTRHSVAPFLRWKLATEFRADFLCFSLYKYLLIEIYKKMLGYQDNSNLRDKTYVAITFSKKIQFTIQVVSLQILVTKLIVLVWKHHLDYLKETIHTLHIDSLKCS